MWAGRRLQGTFTDGKREQLWWCHYQAKGVRSEINFPMDPSVQFSVTCCHLLTPMWRDGCWVWWWLMAQNNGSPTSWCGATIPPCSPSHTHLATIPAFPWLHIQADVNRWRGRTGIRQMRIGGTRKGWKLRVWHRADIFISSTRTTEVYVARRVWQQHSAFPTLFHN